MATNINNPKSSKGGTKGGISIFPAKVKQVILDGSEEGTLYEPTTAEKWGGYDAVGMIFYNKIAIIPDQFSTNIDGFSTEEMYSWDGTAKPLFSYQKYYPLINEVVLIFTTISKDYLEDRRSVQNYYLPMINLWNHPHHNTLPASQNYINDQTEIFNSENYEQAGLLRRVIDGELDIDIPLGKYFKEQLNIHPLLPFEGDHILEGRFGNSIRFGATARSEEIPEQNKNNWSNGSKGENGDPITVIRNGQSVALDGQGWIHATEDINLDPSSIYLTSNQKIDNFIIASDAWHTFGINASVPQNDQDEAQKCLDDPAGFIQDKPLEVEKQEEPKDNQDEVNKGQKGQQPDPSQDQDNDAIDYEQQDQDISGSLDSQASGSLDSQTSGSISEEEAGLEEEEDTIEYYQLDDGQTEPEAIERPPLPESYVLASGGFEEFDNCSNCMFHENNYCNKWEAKVRGKHEQPWVCGSWEELVAPAWTKVPNSTRKGRGGKTASIYKNYVSNIYTSYFHLVESTEEGLGKEGEGNSKVKSQINHISMFPFAYAGSRGWKGFNEAEGKTPQDYLFDGVNKFNHLTAESDVIDVFYQYVNWGKAGDNKSTWPYTLLNQQIFDPEENLNSPLYVEVFIKDKDFDKDTTAGRQSLTNKAKEAFLKKLKKIDKELVKDFEITLDDGYFKKFTGNYDFKKKTRLKCSFKIINLKDKYSG